MHVMYIQRWLHEKEAASVYTIHEKERLCVYITI